MKSALRAAIGAATGFLILVTGGMASVSAAEPPGQREALFRKLALQKSNSAGWAALVQQARERASFCARCHGEDGNSIQPLVPNIAGQNPYYLLEQIAKFADGRRNDYIMTSLARMFSEEDRMVAAAYYSTLAPRPYAVEASLAQRGKAAYQQRCVSCHGTDAHGSEQYARLAGQRVEYLRHRLFTFQQPTDAPTVMHGVAQGLVEEDIQAITAYLASLP